MEISQKPITRGNFIIQANTALPNSEPSLKEAIDFVLFLVTIRTVFTQNDGEEFLSKFVGWKGALTILCIEADVPDHLDCFCQYCNTLTDTFHTFFLQELLEEFRNHHARRRRLTPQENVNP